MSISAACLPTELVIIIFHIAAMQSYPTAAALSLVSRWARLEMEPILYRVVSLPLFMFSSKLPQQCANLLSDPKLMAHLQSFGLLGTVEVVKGLLNALSLVNPRPRIKNLMTGYFRGEMLDAFPYVEELHIMASLRNTLLPAFPRLRRIHHIMGSFLDDTEDPFIRSGHNRDITHVAVSIPLYLMLGFDSFETPRPYVQRIRATLDTYPALVLIVARLLLYSGQKDTFLTDTLAAFGEIRDRRFVIVVSEQEDQTKVWERNAEKGENIWDRASMEQNCMGATGPLIIRT